MLSTHRTGILPAELYRSITEATAFPDLFQLAVVSRTTQVEAERLIWKKFRLKGDKDVAEKCFRRILSIPRVWSLIKTLEYELQEWHLPDRSKNLLDELFATILSNLTNLVSLTIRPLNNNPRSNSRACGKLFEPCRFKLRILRCHFILDTDFSKFLEQQSTITEWEWSPSAQSPQTLPSTVLPNVVAFSTSSPLSFCEHPYDKIIAGRPMTHVCWRHGKPPQPQDLTQSTASIKAIKIGWANEETLKTIPDVLPSLEILALLQCCLKYGPVEYFYTHTFRHSTDTISDT
jgi:hypothetical protein